MSKVVASKISKKEREKLKEILGIKISKLKNKNEVICFLEDLLTESELVMIYRRLQIARMLIEEYTYWQIKNELNVSYDTIKNVRLNLDKSRGGYINFIKKLKT